MSSMAPTINNPYVASGWGNAYSPLMPSGLMPVQPMPMSAPGQYGVSQQQFAPQGTSFSQTSGPTTPLTIKTSAKGLVMDNSFNHADVEMRLKPNGEKGVFAKGPIQRGEIVTIFVGDFVTGQELAGMSQQLQKQSLQVSDNVFQIATRQPHLNPQAFDLAENYNHSCNPNLFLAGNNVLVAGRDIQPGEELFFDYGTSDGPFNPDRGWQCDCGARQCRKQTTPFDYRQLVPYYGPQRVSRYLATKFQDEQRTMSSNPMSFQPQPYPIAPMAAQPGQRFNTVAA
jgi:hypothetical protein